MTYGVVIISPSPAEKKIYIHLPVDSLDLEQADVFIRQLSHAVQVARFAKKHSCGNWYPMPGDKYCSGCGGKLPEA